MIKPALLPRMESGSMDTRCTAAVGSAVLASTAPLTHLRGHSRRRLHIQMRCSASNIAVVGTTVPHLREHSRFRLLTGMR